MSNAQAASKNPVAIFRGDLMAREPEFKAALPAYLPPEKFIRTTVTAIQHNPAILNCDKQSILTACMKAAGDGLLLDGREAALVERKVKNQDGSYSKIAVYTPMVDGIKKLVRNSGELSSLTALVVFKNDTFKFNPALDDVPQHEPDWFGTRGEPIGVYAVAKLKDGTIVVEVMSKAEVMKIGSATPNAHQYDPAKGASYGEWWRKTVIRRISKYLPKSTDRPDDARLVNAVERIDEDFDFVDSTEVTQPKSAKRTKKAAEILNADTIDVDPETGEITDGAGPVSEAAEGDVM